MLHWLQSGETFQPEITPKHQLIYLMEGNASINLEDRQAIGEAARGAGRLAWPCRLKPRRDSRGGRRFGEVARIWWSPRFPVSFTCIANRPFVPVVQPASSDATARAVVREHRADICVVGAGISGVSGGLRPRGLGRNVVTLTGRSACARRGLPPIPSIGMMVGLHSGNPPTINSFTHGIADDIIRRSPRLRAI